jgi:hypothetical protein
MTPPSAQHDTRQHQLTAALAALGYCLPGTLTERYTRCSSPGCRCRTADPPALHGPYHSWTRKIAGKTVTRTLTPKQAERYAPWFAHARKLRALTAELEAHALQIASHSEGWGEK